MRDTISYKIPFLLLLFLVVLFGQGAQAEGEKKAVFPALENKEEFAAEMSSLIEKAWIKWQDSVLIDDVDVEGARGLLLPGDMGKTVITSSSIMASFDRTGRSQDYINCVKAVADAMENGMRIWQRGYSNEGIPFPQGASCTFTLTPCENVPVAVSSGKSSGDKTMTGHALYNYMLYRSPGNGEDVLTVFRGTARAISECFSKWKNRCSIVGIIASGGMAPAPAPMGSGPGPVRNAKGQNGKLMGPYFDGALMRSIMVEYFAAEEKTKT